jgi:hypothetical protein
MSEGHWPQPWAMAKLMRLFPGAVTIHPTDPDYQGYFRIAQAIANSGVDVGSTDMKCFETASFEEELGKLYIPPALTDFLRYLLRPDFKQRPTAMDALSSKHFHDLG